MIAKRKIIPLILGSLITILLVYVLSILFDKDTAFSVVPGWHTIMYPPELVWAVIAIICLNLSFAVYSLFFVIVKLLRNKDT